MPDILVRDLGPELIAALERKAARNGRSLEAEVKRLLEQASRDDMLAFRATADRIREAFGGRTFSDCVELLREDRER